MIAYNKKSKSLNPFKAFTLAEVLITMGIIGVVASLTIPNLINKYNESILKLQWKKEFGVISNAFLKLVIDKNGSINNIYPTNTGSESFKNDIKQNLSYTKDCLSNAIYNNTGTLGNGASADGCWHKGNEWFYLYGGGTYSVTLPGVVLSDGTLIIFNYMYGDCSDVPTGSDFTRCGVITIDVNGFKKPNTYGRDIFAVSITPTSLIPHGARGFTTVDPAITCLDESHPDFKLNTNTGYGCSAKFLME